MLLIEFGQFFVDDTPSSDLFLCVFGARYRLATVMQMMLIFAKHLLMNLLFVVHRNVDIIFASFAIHRIFETLIPRNIVQLSNNSVRYVLDGQHPTPRHTLKLGLRSCLYRQHVAETMAFLRVTSLYFRKQHQNLKNAQSIIFHHYHCQPMVEEEVTF